MTAPASPFVGVREDRLQTHAGGVVEGRSPLVVRTPPERWSYAVSLPAGARGLFGRRSGPPLWVEAEIEVLEGDVGVACTRDDHRTVLTERFASAADGPVTLRQQVSGAQLGFVVVRNASPRGEASRVRILSLRVAERAPGDVRALVDIPRRRVEAEGVPDRSGVESFDDAQSQRINAARLERLESLGLPLENRSVLDVGSGVGHLSPFFTQRGCRYLGVEGRAENVARMRELYPSADARVADVQCDPLLPLGRFDVVLCFGLLYHLENPVGALRNIASATGDLLLLETMVCDSSRPVLLLADESLGYNQALTGLGSRPSPSFVVMALNRVGFSHVYTPARPPRHADFEVAWRDDLARQRDGHDLRCMFVASRRRIESSALLELL